MSTPDPRFLGGETAVLSDTEDFALVVLVGFDGAADCRANGITHKYGATILRQIADLWDQRDD